MSAQDIYLQVFSAMPACRPLADVSFSPQVTGVSVTMSDQFGWDDGRIGYLAQGADGTTVEAFLPEPVAVEDGAIVVVSQGGDVLYMGVVMEASPTSITCQGFGRWATRWSGIERGDDGVVSMGTILSHGLEQLPWLTVLELVNTNVFHTWAELQYRSTYDVIQQAIAEGGIPQDSAGHRLTERAVSWMWLVYGQLQHGRPQLYGRFIPKLASDYPDYLLPYDPLAMQGGWKLDIVDAVRVAYQVNGVPTTTEWKYRDGVDPRSDWLRRETLTGSATPTGAVAVAETFLAQHNAPQLAMTIQLTDGQGFAMRPGTTVEMLGMGKALVSQNQSDYFAKTSTVTLGEPSRTTWQGFVRTVDRAVLGLQRNRSIVTGARTG